MKKHVFPTLILTILMILSLLLSTACGTSLTPSGACQYATTRSTEGRDISYAVITVQCYGDITLLLDGTTAPITVANFKKLADAHFYDGLTFHRVISDFMIQGGDPEGDGTGSSDEQIKGEFSGNGHYNDISHLRGVISMARSSAPNSASCQFFICNADATYLNGSYAAFGYVLCGMNIVDAITENTASLGDSNGIIDNVKQRAVIESIRIVSADDVADLLLQLASEAA